jgi:Yip1 domain
MTDTEIAEQKPAAGMFDIAINILTSPAEAFEELKLRPSKLFPLLAIVLSTAFVMFWYFTIVDFDWYIDDTLSMRDLTEEQLEAAREQMNSMSRPTFRLISTIASVVGLLFVYILQAGYFSLTSALSGSGQKFSHWFSLVLWTGLPYLLSVVGMVVTILLSSNGQLSAYDLDPLTLANLGMQSSNDSLMTVFRSLSLTMLWGLSLTVMGYRHWLDCSLIKALAIVLAPYLLIFSIGAYVALS